MLPLGRAWRRVDFSLQGDSSCVACHHLLLARYLVLGKGRRSMLHGRSRCPRLGHGMKPCRKKEAREIEFLSA